MKWQLKVTGTHWKSKEVREGSNTTEHNWHNGERKGAWERQEAAVLGMEDRTAD